MAESRIIPVRTAAVDSNSAADINELSAEALDKAGTEQIVQITEETSPADDDLFLMERDSDGALRRVKSSNIGGSADAVISIPAGAWDLPSTNYAPFDTDSGTNGEMRRHLFDDTTEEQVEAQIVMPASISGTVTFEIYGYAATAAASKNVEFTLYHSSKTDAENWDAAYSSKVSGDLATDSTQDQLDRFTFTETVSTLGWTANDLIRIKLGRTAPSANNLVGDYGLISFRILIPA